MGLHKTWLIVVLGFLHSGVGQEFWSNVISQVPVGVPGVDYPSYTAVPRRTSFTCRDRKPGFYADPDTRCQVWHWCDTFLIKHSFLCPNMTVFSQKIRGCDWWYNVNCDLAVSLYSNNDELYGQGTDAYDDDRESRKEVQETARPVQGLDIPRVRPLPREPDVPVQHQAEPDSTHVDDTALPSIVTQPLTTPTPVTIPASPATGGILRRRPFTRVPPPSNNFHPVVNNNNNNAIPLAFPLPTAATASTSSGTRFHLTAAAPPTGEQGSQFDFPAVPETRQFPDDAFVPPQPSHSIAPTSSLPVTPPSTPSSLPTVNVDFTSPLDVARTPSIPGTDNIPFASEEEEQSQPTLPVTNSDPETRPPGSSGFTRFSTAQARPSTFYTFTPFASRPTTTVGSARPVFQSSPSTTPRPAFLAVSRITPRISEEPPTRPFDFGVPFGARIGAGSGATRRVDNVAPTQTTSGSAGSALNSLSVDATSQVSNEVTVPTSRRRKFVVSSGRPTFPPFPVSTSSPPTTITPSAAAILEQTSSATTATDPSTTRRRTFPSFPITTFKPSTTTPAPRPTLDGNFGDKDFSSSSVITDNVIALLNATSFPLNDDLSLV